MPSRHSLFWRLAGLLIAFVVLLVWLTTAWGTRVEIQGYSLSEAAKVQLRAYAADAERAWLRDGAAGLDAWQAELARRESGWSAVLGPDLQPLGHQRLETEQLARLTSLRAPDWPMTRRANGLPYVNVPFAQHPEVGQLVMRLPERFLPGGYSLPARLLITGLVPALLALLLGAGLYRLLLAPLTLLREQANALRGDRLTTRMAAGISGRSDELGDLGRALDHMAERLQHSVLTQQQLLRALTHELRTPLSRLRVAAESAESLPQLRERLEREVDLMQRLAEDSLQLAWLDSDRSALPTETVEVAQLWAVLAEDACFETGWPVAQLDCELDEQCRVQGHLNSLAQALENLLRNAIRHSPATGRIHLGGQRTGAHWELWLEDQGGGVPGADLERIFEPFFRLQGSPPGAGGFGLGLSIARRSLERQGGRLWAQNGVQGLRLHLHLPAESV
ncbi:MAG: histidine kinase sensor domain-containing protein [Pseudomonas sp.]|uniref:HAMP domain-containing sensor histidine kinase n=1 Tax=Pseudomonas sp. TaxID=306 RepID=UPI003395A7A5